ncbi:hypothetical protein ACIPSA_42155 [Streptomyces sp. NPDC086549]|uniref:hypothetical protein n=1 Tax=Streptomyces sp. NPDC086549 TaxID=3365752 RepID=UPI00382C7152
MLVAAFATATLATSAGSAVADPPSHVHYVKGSDVWVRGCHGYLNAYGIGRNFHVQAVVYNQTSTSSNVDNCSGYLLRKHGRHGRWLRYGQQADPNNDLSAQDVGSWDATGFYKDPKNWWAKACVYAWIGENTTAVRLMTVLIAHRITAPRCRCASRSRGPGVVSAEQLGRPRLGAGELAGSSTSSAWTARR